MCGAEQLRSLISSIKEDARMIIVSSLSTLLSRVTVGKARNAGDRKRAADVIKHLTNKRGDDMQPVLQQPKEVGSVEHLSPFRGKERVGRYV
jgi:hypothetical protein